MYTRCEVRVRKEFGRSISEINLMMLRMYALICHYNNMVHPYNTEIIFLCSHFAITHKPWVWKLVGSTHDFFNGASMYAWMHQHTLGHHPYTNIDGADPDIRTGERVSSHYLLITLLAFVQKEFTMHVYSCYDFDYSGYKNYVR